MTLWIHPNVGAEEPLPATPPPAVACVARLWSLLFAEGSRRTDAPDPTERPQSFGLAGERAAWRWLGDEAGLRAWWNDAGAARAAEERGVPLLGPAPEIVRRVHDKAFALEACRDAGYEPRSLRDLARAFSAEELEDAEGALAAIEARVGEWPGWIGGRFCLKPRLGGSGRGRVAGDAHGGVDRDAIRRALPRLARQGGAVLEPWLERERDHSTQLLVQEDGTLTLLASLELRVTASGVYRGHAGRLDHRRRVASGHPDEGLLEAACAVAAAAHAQGFRGPCGVDAFAFRGERGTELRPVVELNARFTTGTLVAGLIRLARKRIDTHLPADPGAVRSFDFALAPPEAGWPDDDARTLCLRFGEDPGGFAPALVVRREG